jgi:biotin carboxylase
LTANATHLKRQKIFQTTFAFFQKGFWGNSQGVFRMCCSFMSRFHDARPNSYGAVVIVGPYSSGALLANPVRALRLSPIAVVAELPKEHAVSGFDYKPTDFDSVFTYHGNVDELTRQILSVGKIIRAVVAGSEWGACLADKLRARLREKGVFTVGNDARNTEYRRDKGLMAAHLAAAGVPIPGQFVSENVKELIDWSRKRAAWPLVVKPPRNAGTAGVRLCFSEEQLRQAFADIRTNRPNAMLEIDDKVLVQEKLHGTEYAVNGVRSDGQTFFTGIWEYERSWKKGAATIYVTDRLLAIDEAPGDLRGRAVAVLDSLELNDGPFHLEMIDTADRGPLPLDLGARLCGGGLCELEAKATDRDPLRMVLQSHLEPEKLGGHISPNYTKYREAAVFFISSSGDDKVASQAPAEELRRWQNDGIVSNFRFYFDEGTRLPVTIDSETVIASVSIVTPSRRKLEQVIRKIRLWQSAGRFEHTQPTRSAHAVSNFNPFKRALADSPTFFPIGNPCSG